MRQNPWLPHVPAKSIHRSVATIRLQATSRAEPGSNRTAGRRLCPDPTLCNTSIERQRALGSQNGSDGRPDQAVSPYCHGQQDAAILLHSFRLVRGGVAGIIASYGAGSAIWAAQVVCQSARLSPPTAPLDVRSIPDQTIKKVAIVFRSNAWSSRPRTRPNSSCAADRVRESPARGAGMQARRQRRSAACLYWIIQNRATTVIMGGLRAEEANSVGAAAQGPRSWNARSSAWNSMSSVLRAVRVHPAAICSKRYADRRAGVWRGCGEGNARSRRRASNRRMSGGTRSISATHDAAAGHYPPS